MSSSTNGLPLSLTGSGVAVASDVIPIYDQSAGTTKKITVEELVANTSSFVQSGSGAIAGTVQGQLRKFTFLSDWTTSGQYDTAKMLLSGTVALPKTQFIKQGVGLAQVEIIGTATRYATFRCTGDGTDDGDLTIQQTGDNVWMQSLTDGYRLTLALMPFGSAAIAPANLELYSNDYIAGGGVDWSRLRVHSKGTSENAHEITSEKNGSGTVHPIHMYIGGIANGLYLNTDGLNGIGTTTPRRKWDILDASDPQLRLSQADNSVYHELKEGSDGVLLVNGSGGTQGAFGNTASSVNYAQLLGGATLGAPGLLMVGETNVSFTVNTKGDGQVLFNADGGGSNQFAVQRTASAVNYPIVTGAATGANPSIKASAENLLIGSGSALATTATAGYVMFPSCAGTPTGVPTGQAAGKIPMIFDTTGVKLWFYTGGAWKGVVVA